MGLFNDLFGNDQKKRGEAFGLFSYMDEQNEAYKKDEKRKQELDNGDSYSHEEDDLEEDDYYYEDDE